MPKGGRIPTGILKQTGSYRTHEHADRLDANMELQEVHRIENLDAPEQEILNDLLTTMPAGVLCSLDTPMIRMALDQHRYYRRAMKSLNSDPYNVSKRNAMTAAREGYLKLARELGLTPNARAAMKSPVTAASEDPFLDVIARQAR